MTDLERTKQVLDKLLLDYKIENYDEYIKMDIYIDKVEYCGAIWFNLDESLKEKEKNDE